MCAKGVGPTISLDESSRPPAKLQPFQPRFFSGPSSWLQVAAPASPTRRDAPRSGTSRQRTSPLPYRWRPGFEPCLGQAWLRDYPVGLLANTDAPYANLRYPARCSQLAQMADAARAGGCVNESRTHSHGTRATKGRGHGAFGSPCAYSLLNNNYYYSI